jgi:hypothetical protein
MVSGHEQIPFTSSSRVEALNMRPDSKQGPPAGPRLPGILECYGVGIATWTWFENPLSLPVESTAVVT